MLFLEAALLGIVEGLTEFLPVSSTGHLILASDLLGFEGPGSKSFEIAIQLGAILAICLLYRQKLWQTTRRIATDRTAQRFALNVLIAFLPAAVIGAFAHSFIKAYLFSPTVVSISLITGGIAILLIERMKPVPRIHDVDDMKPLNALQIGLCQVVSMIPGVSRSGATIMGGMLFGLDRKAAAEFSFFLAIPTIFAATVYDLYKNRADLTVDGGLLIAVGFTTAFLSSLVVVKWLIGYVSRHGFTPFAYYRIAVGALMLMLLHI